MRGCAQSVRADMDKLLVVFVVLGGYVEVAELKYQHNKVRRAKMA